MPYATIPTTCRAAAPPTQLLLLPTICPCPSLVNILCVDSVPCVWRVSQMECVCPACLEGRNLCCLPGGQTCYTLVMPTYLAITFPAPMPIPLPPLPPPTQLPFVCYCITTLVGVWCGGWWCAFPDGQGLGGGVGRTGGGQGGQQVPFCYPNPHAAGVQVCGRTAEQPQPACPNPCGTSWRRAGFGVAAHSLACTLCMWCHVLGNLGFPTQPITCSAMSHLEEEQWWWWVGVPIVMPCACW